MPISASPSINSRTASCSPSCRLAAPTIHCGDLARRPVAAGTSRRNRFCYRRSLRSTLPLAGTWFEHQQLRSLKVRGFSPTDASLGTIAVVPGAFHRERSPQQTGADGQVLKEESERLGFAVTIARRSVCVHQSANWAIVRDWLAQRFADPVLLVSLSKGTAE